MKKLIITADDFGVFPSINEGVTQAVLNGKVNSVACLPNHSKSIANARALMDETGDMAELGCHFTITSGEPLIVKDEGAFTYGKFFRPFNELDIDAIEREPEKLERELCAQVEVFLDNQVPIKHLSCHHTTLTTTKPLLRVYLSVAEKYKLPVRSVNIVPTQKDSDFRLALKLLLLDDVPGKKLREMKKFSKEIVAFCKTFEKVKMPGALESRHYGPLPVADVWDASWARRVKRKHGNIKKFYKEFLESDYTVAEFMVHLVNYDAYLAGLDNGIVYPGINRKYFDSRHLEYRSVMAFDFRGFHPDVSPGRWGDIS